ncbi:katanin p60 ATPase-containing subunit A-like 2 isoform X2, partial [Clarias magur]
MELSYQAIKTANQAREADELRTETRKRNLLVLIYHHLIEEGYVDAASALEQETHFGLRKFEVCDNVDLDTVLMEYESFHFIKFQKYPKLSKKLPEQAETKRVRSSTKKRISSVKQTLPRIPCVQRPPSRNGIKKQESKAVGLDEVWHCFFSCVIMFQENGGSYLPESNDFGLNVSPVVRNGVGDGMQVKKCQLVDYRGLIQDAINEPNSLSCNPDPSDRLLKPISAFCGMNSEMRELAAVISKDIYLHNPNVHWDDIIGLEAAKRLVKEAVVYPIKYPQLFTGILSPWKGLLLYGPPGTGKTMLAKAVATECKTTFFNISASSIVSKWRGDSEKLVRVLFELARYHAPSTIFLDELESVMSQRGVGPGGEHEGSRRMKTELLVQMDGLARSNDLVFVLAASNLPWELDHAMLRRLEKRILVGLPSGPARKAMISHWLPPISNTGGVELRTELDYNKLAEQTDGYSGSDIRLVCKEAAMRPVRKIFDTLENHTEAQSHVSTGHSHMPIIRLETVTTDDFLQVMASRRALKAVLIDLSGTLHIEDVAVPGAQEALARLRRAPVAVKFVTNTTKECKRTLLERLRRLSFEIDEREIFTSLTGARNLLEQKQVRPLLLVEDSALEDFTGIETSDPNAVVIGLAPDHFNYEMLNKAFRLILDGAPLIAIHKARYYKRKDGLALGPGPFVTGLEYSTDSRAVVVGKPEKTFFLEALRDLNCSPEEAVMIGDDARDDVGGAQNTGMLGILVKT